MAKTLHVDGNSGKAYIYNNDAAPSTYANPSASQLGDLHFHSDLSYLGNTQILEVTVNHPERVRSGSKSKWNGTHWNPQQGTQTHVLGTNALGAVRPAVVFYQGAQMPAGFPVQIVSQSIRSVSVIIKAGAIELFENWFTFDDTLPAVSRTYRVHVFQTLFSPSGNTSIRIEPGLFTAGFGKLSSAYRYLRRNQSNPDFHVTTGKTADVQGGGLRIVLPNGTTPYSASTYTGGFAGVAGTGIQI
jgi:hypothetical protein